MSINSFRNSVLGVSPYLEVAVRTIYWQSDLLIKFKSRRDKISKRKKKTSTTPKTSLSRLEDKLRKLGIKEGDLLIVHSSFSHLKKLTGATPLELIDCILKLLGKNGTLAIPTIPNYNTSEMSTEIITQDVSEIILNYNPKETPAATGIIPNTFLKYAGVVRSHHPLNTLAALGPLADQMMEKNLDGYQPLPCGEYSSWKYCVDNNAKILALGVDLAHSLTMIHVAEDINPNWPITDWYRERKFCIIEDNDMKKITVRERHPRWAMHYAERTLSKDLLKSGIMKSVLIDGIKVQFIDNSKILMDFLQKNTKIAYPYYFLKRI